MQDKTMEAIVALCKRRGFIFQSSEIYGGINGFWDYGPLGVELKRNVREAWWRDMITNHDDLNVCEGAPASYQMTGMETSIIMHPNVWKASGHFDLFSDMMVDCRESNKRYRFDQIRGRWINLDDLLENDNSTSQSIRRKITSFEAALTLQHGAELKFETNNFFIVTDQDDPSDAVSDTIDRAAKLFEVRRKYLSDESLWKTEACVTLKPEDNRATVVAPAATTPGTLTDPREFNLMLETYPGAVKDESNRAFLRPETAQGMFVNFKNVCDSSRVKVPFGIAQVGKSFRNEITPRNFTFRSREFEQMEMEFFCHPDESRKWYEYWRDRRYNWYINLGITGDKLILRDHEEAELAHYSVGTADIEYAFPFLEEGEYGELEGVAHRGNFDLRSHMEGKLTKDAEGNLIVELDENGQPKYRGSGKDLTYYDDDAFLRDKESLGLKSFKAYCEQRKEEADPGAPYRYIPHVIEPAAGADRATLAFICEAFTEDEAPDDKGKMQKRTVMRFHPQLAPIKAAVFPLIKKEGMPEKAAAIYGALKKAGVAAYYDQQGAIGRRYRRQDEIGTPFCLTVDGETATDNCVTLRDRDTLAQERVPIDDVVAEIKRRVEG